MPTNNWITSEQFVKGIGQRLRNAPITVKPVGQMFLLAGCDEKYGK
jgi:hypothetical protein